MVSAGSIDNLLYDIIHLIDEYIIARLGMKRTRNQVGSSLTLPSLRPDFCGIVRHAMMLIGEERPNRADMHAAIGDLIRKKSDWSDCLHGEVNGLWATVSHTACERTCSLHWLTLGISSDCASAC